MRQPIVRSATTDELEPMISRVDAAAEVLRAATPSERAGLLVSIASALDHEGPALTELAGIETNLPQPRLKAELSRTTFQLRQLAQVVRAGHVLRAAIEPADSNEVLGPRPDLRSIRVPIGPVLVFAASNFPFAFSVAGGDAASALAAGCPVLVKAHPGHPRLSERCHSVIQAALPAGLRGAVEVIYGVEAGRRALGDPRIRAAAFTGSTTVGRALFDLASTRPDPIPFYGELGSINPVFVSEGVVRDDAASLTKGFVDSFTLGVGQFCTKPGLIFLPEGHDLDARLEIALAETCPAPMLGDWAVDRFDEALSVLDRHPSVKTLLRGSSDGLFTSPSLYSVSLTQLGETAAELLDRECFGPAAVLVEYSAPDEPMLIAARLAPSLTATIHARPEEGDWASRVLAVLESRVGRIIMNGWPTGVAVSPAMHHGGPYPASTSLLYSSVGGNAIERFLRPVCYQNVADEFLPLALRDTNPLGIPRWVRGELSLDSLAVHRA
jgi:NADP-dependent aldehyde dehydrogenase